MIINIRNEINKSFFFIISSLLPLEVVQLWESHDLCIEGNKTISSKIDANILIKIVMNV